MNAPRTRTLPNGMVARVPELERHTDDLARLSESHPLHSIAAACIQDSPEDRLSAVVLCQRLGELKLSPIYKLFPSIGQGESINTIATSSAGVFSSDDQVGASRQLEAVTQAMQLMPPGADIQLMREERQRAQTEAERLTREKDELRAELGNVQQQREHLQEELGETQRDKDTLRAELGDVQQQREHLQEELGETQREKDTLRAELGNVQQQREHLQEELGETQREKDTLRAELEEAQQQREELREELEDTQREKDEAQESVVLVAHERDTLRGELDEAKVKEEEAQEESRHLRNEVERHRSEARVLRQRAVKASTDVSNLTHDRNGLRHEKEELQEAVGQARHREEELREHINTLRNELRRARWARQDVEALRARCEDLEKDQNQLDMLVSLLHMIDFVTKQTKHMQQSGACVNTSLNTLLKAALAHVKTAWKGTGWQTNLREQSKIF